MSMSSQTIVTQAGRTIRITEAGQRDGVPVLAHHGTPGSGYLYDSWVADAQSRGIRLISYDRPGYGGSIALPGRAVAQAAEDVAAIAQALDLDRLLVWGVSGGGPHALACAALLPDLVVAAAAICSPAPYTADGLDWFAGMAEDNLAEFGAALEGRAALEPFIAGAAAGIRAASPAALVEAFGGFLSPADAAVFTEANAEQLLHGFHEGLTERGEGWVDDDLTITASWGFDPGQIQIPVLLLHGEQDLFVPFAHGQWLANHIHGVEARLTADDGHLTLIFQRIPEVHAWLLSKMM